MSRSTRSGSTNIVRSRMSAALCVVIASLTINVAPQFALSAQASSVGTPVGTELQVLSDVVIGVNGLNVRSSAGLSGKIIGKLALGSRVTPSGKSADGKWWQIDFDGQAAFIFAAYTRSVGSPTTPTPTGAISVRVTSSTLNIRSGPGTSYAIVGRFKLGDIVQSNGRRGAWLLISYNGKAAYIYAPFTTRSTGSPVTQPPPVSVAPAPSSGGQSFPPPSTTGWNFELGGHFLTFDNLSTMHDVGMTWAKTQVVFDQWAPDIKGQINTAHANGFKLLVGAVGNRALAADSNYQKQFAQQLASLASQGADAIEVWNEPNLDREYGGSGTGKVSPESYTNLLRTSYSYIKGARRSTLVIAAATAPTGYFGGGCSNVGCDDEPFLTRMARAGAANYMDCVGAHHNGTMVGPDTTSGAPVGSSDHHQWYFQGTLAVVSGAFGGRVPICWTELGYVTGEGIGSLPAGFGWGSNITLANQAAWLGRAAVLSRNSGRVRFMVVWNVNARQFDSDPQAGFSIVRPDGSCPSCASLKSAMGR